MIVLSLECAAGGCGVCVWQDGRALALRQEAMERGQDSRLVPLVQEAMSAAALRFEQVDRLAVTTGPGSFTGLRIGLATARGLGFAAHKPVLGLDRFSIYRAQFAACKEPLLVVLESRRQELYTRFFPSHDLAPEACLMTQQEIVALVENHKDILLVGDAAESLRGCVDQHVFKTQTEAEALTCAALAAQALPEDPAFLPRPFYLRAPDVTIKAIIDP